MRVSHYPVFSVAGNHKLMRRNRIVEYATREQAQNAVNTLSNQNLMGRLVYVREVRIRSFHLRENLYLTIFQGP